MLYISTYNKRGGVYEVIVFAPLSSKKHLEGRNQLWESRVRRQSKDGYEFVENAEKAGNMGIVPAS